MIFLRLIWRKTMTWIRVVVDHRWTLMTNCRVTRSIPTWCFRRVLHLYFLRLRQPLMVNTKTNRLSLSLLSIIVVYSQVFSKLFWLATKSTGTQRALFFSSHWVLSSFSLRRLHEETTTTKKKKRLLTFRPLEQKPKAHTCLSLSQCAVGIYPIYPQEGAHKKKKSLSCLYIERRRRKK